MTEPLGLNVGDHERFRSLVERLIELLGSDWVEEKIVGFQRDPSIVSHANEGHRLLKSLASYRKNLDALVNSRPPPDPESLLFLGMVALIASECSLLPGGKNFTKKLRDLARAERFGQFFDTLFEGEAAIYWREQMRARMVGFPPGPHPDFWATVVLQGTELRLANECKRVSPNDRNELAAEELSGALEAEVRQLYTSLGALKVIVWLHVPAEDVERAVLVQLVRNVASEASMSATVGQWHTASDAAGLIQVSAAADHEHGEWAEREIIISDVPAVGPLRVAVETRFLGKPQDLSRLKYVLSLRSDVLPNRIGAFERNLNKAVRQATLSRESVCGVVNIRLRPPRAIGDLFEADAIVRRALRETASHVALVVLYWNDGDREDGQWQVVDGERQREVIVKYSLQTHFIAHNPSPVDFRSLDSAKHRFPETAGLPMRDRRRGRSRPSMSLSSSSSRTSRSSRTIKRRLRRMRPPCM